MPVNSSELRDADPRSKVKSNVIFFYVLEIFKSPEDLPLRHYSKKKN